MCTVMLSSIFFWCFSKDSEAEKILKVDYFENSDAYQSATTPKRLLLLFEKQNFSYITMFCILNFSVFFFKNVITSLFYGINRKKIEVCINLLSTMSVRLPRLKRTFFISAQEPVLIQVFRHLFCL